MGYFILPIIVILVIVAFIKFLASTVWGARMILAILYGGFLYILVLLFGGWGVGVIIALVLYSYIFAKN